jgi:hypothetical protein
VYANYRVIYTDGVKETLIGGVAMGLESVGSNIRKYRLMKKMRQEDLAEKAGLSTNYVGALERGEKVPSLETLIDILNALDISADMVLCDVIHKGYEVKHSLLAEKLDKLTQEDRARIYDVIDTLIRHSAKRKP